MDSEAGCRRVRTLPACSVAPVDARDSGFPRRGCVAPGEDREVAFVTLTRFDSLDAIRVFASDGYEVPGVGTDGARVAVVLWRPRAALRHLVIRGLTAVQLAAGGGASYDVWVGERAQSIAVEPTSSVVAARSARPVKTSRCGRAVDRTAGRHRSTGNGALAAAQPTRARSRTIRRLFVRASSRSIAAATSLGGDSVDQRLPTWRTSP